MPDDSSQNDLESGGGKPAPTQQQRRTPRLIAILAGVSALAALVLFIAHSGDITAFARQAANAKAGPLAGAVAVQSLPYILAAYVWLLFLRRMGTAPKLASLIPLSFAKLFADQALPSGGISGAAFFLFALTRRGVPDKTAFRTFVFATSAYFLAFLIAAIISLIALSTAEKAPPALSASVSAFAGLFLLLTLIAGLVVLYKPETAPAFVRKRRLTAKAAEFAGAAIHDIRTMPSLFMRMTIILIAVRAVDGFTLMLISEAIGAPISFSTGFIAVAIASIAATIGPVPMGLGTFEAGMIASLSVFGASVEDALTITLIYRGLTLWLPLLPGFLIIQREFLHRPAALSVKGTDADQS
ncbi:lysylphosphatidylglycerol synthase transmembrane domain-containing protein [Hyphococcus sp.]|uniref:lysylphosphatidylglycerol synthase transmembrane domain-containing protein n=1 Tax=Hyphococcus sp. TaxID=2038636 RepID=UPI0035C6A975